MALAIEAAVASPDPSTQNGAVLATQDGIAVFGTTACNEFPHGVHYMTERWERPAKYSYIEHAERNAIYAAAREGMPTRGLVMYCPWAACADCARAIIQARLSKLVTISPTANTNERWVESIEVAMVMLRESHVEVEYMEPEQLKGFVLPLLRRDGQAMKVA
jgi:dCMP deaminase